MNLILINCDPLKGDCTQAGDNINWYCLTRTVLAIPKPYELTNTAYKMAFLQDSSLVIGGKRSYCVNKINYNLYLAQLTYIEPSN